ncbi:MAG: DnaB-like helicase C-terminal domain-containing protein [Ghiorsea sp.]|nr:DnaB-like helicase C-terminal domain-containing protein [Ghiorsea sp.]
MITGLTTGFVDLDKQTDGLQQGDLIIIAGRPSMGKTAFAMNLAQNAEEGAVVAFFSLEMPSQQISMRLLASESKVNMSKMETHHFDKNGWSEMVLKNLSSSKIFVEDTPAIGVAEIRTKCRRLNSDEGRLDMVLIDYLQLMTGSATAEKRDFQISEMMRALKGLAKELDVPVLVLSQLNRALESRADKRPIMSDLRELAAIEPAADMVMFIYRDEVYSPKSENEGVAEIIVAKHRNGLTGTVRLAFLKKYARFENWAVAN